MFLPIPFKSTRYSCQTVMCIRRKDSTHASKALPHCFQQLTVKKHTVALRPPLSSTRYVRVFTLHPIHSIRIRKVVKWSASEVYKSRAYQIRHHIWIGVVKRTCFDLDSTFKFCAIMNIQNISYALHLSNVVTLVVPYHFKQSTHQIEFFHLYSTNGSQLCGNMNMNMVKWCALTSNLLINYIC